MKHNGRHETISLRYQATALLSFLLYE